MRLQGKAIGRASASTSSGPGRRVHHISSPRYVRFGIAQLHTPALVTSYYARIATTDSLLQSRLCALLSVRVRKLRSVKKTAKEPVNLKRRRLGNRRCRAYAAWVTLSIPNREVPAPYHNKLGTNKMLFVRTDRCDAAGKYVVTQWGSSRLFSYIYSHTHS